MPGTNKPGMNFIPGPPPGTIHPTHPFSEQSSIAWMPWVAKSHSTAYLPRAVSNHGGVRRAFGSRFLLWGSVWSLEALCVFFDLDGSLSDLVGSLRDPCGIPGSLRDPCGILAGSLRNPCGILAGSLRAAAVARE